MAKDWFTHVPKKVPETRLKHIFYCAWLKTQVETCVTGTLDMSRAQVETRQSVAYQ